MAALGILAIFNDCRAGREADFEAWFQGEHLLERLDNPTPMTRKVMSEVFVNASRTLCRRTLRRGGFRGAFVVTVRFVDDTPDTATLARLADHMVKDPAVTACEIWDAIDPAGQPVSKEEKLRGGDKKIKSCPMV